MAETHAVRVTISVTADLKKQMDAVPENVNWSAVAAEAFRGKLLELQATRKGKNMEATINRLKAAKELEECKLYQDGKETGEQWAKDKATPKQLKRLFDADTNSGPGGLLDGEPDSYGWAGLIARAIEGPNTQIDRDYWVDVMGEDEVLNMYDEQFSAGFVDGALRIWRIVADKI